MVPRRLQCEMRWKERMPLCPALSPFLQVKRVQTQSGPQVREVTSGSAGALQGVKAAGPTQAPSGTLAAPRVTYLE
ncbi:hypothetical protein U0070_007431 [Myodes glareolus]|uniref:Uncharacterized protein n=1 Tax=Myodes glareolus TaxID=447135 RepID=A0AAW0HYA5_MYOGA